MVMKKLTHELLRDLLEAGYNVLESDRELPDPYAVLTPKTVDDLDEYINTLDDDHFRQLFISECLGWPEEDLQGLVKVDHPS